MSEKKTIFFIIILISSFIPVFADTVEVPFTLDDRDRLIRLEVEQKSLRNEITSLRNEMSTRFESVDRRFESLQKQIDHIITVIYFILGAIVAIFVAMLSLGGYIIWDRRTTLYPIKRKTDELEEKNTIIINVLKKQAKGNKQLSEILKLAGVL